MVDRKSRVWSLNTWFAQTDNRWVVGVIVASLGFGIFLYCGFLANSRLLWDSFIHDRNAHYFNAQTLAIDLQNGDLAHLLKDLERMRIWGPLHPIVTGVVMSVVGIDFRIAILVSLFAWVATAILSFLVVRRSLDEGGNTSGCVAAFFVLISPAYRAYALDIMLESLGALLSITVAYFYLRARQNPSRGNDRFFALSLTALFFLKYNYWILLLGALALLEINRHQRVLVHCIKRIRIPNVFWVLNNLWRHPLHYPLLGLMTLMVAFRIFGTFRIPFGDSGVVVNGIDLPATLFCWCFAIRVLDWWFRERGNRLFGRVPRVRSLISWHLIPVLAWFMIPQRAGLFLTYLTRDHGSGESGNGLVERLTAYVETMALHYHGNWALFGSSVFLVIFAFAGLRRLKKGGEIVLWVILVSVVLTAIQPCCRSRFLHSWMVLFWAGAGIGSAILAKKLSGLLFIKGIRLVPIGVSALLVVLAWPILGKSGQAPESGIRNQGTSALALAETVLGDFQAQGKVAILSNQPMKFYAMWTYQQAIRQTEKVETETHFRANTVEAFEQWLAKAGCESVVWIDVKPLPGMAFVKPDGSEQNLLAVLQQQHLLNPVEFHLIPELGCTVTVWRKDSGLVLKR